MADLNPPETAYPCRAPEQRASCCESSDKAECCCHGGMCDCNAVRSDVRERIAVTLTRQEFEEALAHAGLADVEIRQTHRVHEHAAAAIVHARKPAP